MPFTDVAMSAPQFAVLSLRPIHTISCYLFHPLFTRFCARIIPFSPFGGAKILTPVFFRIVIAAKNAAVSAPHKQQPSHETQKKC